MKNKMEVYTGFSAPVRRWLMNQRVKAAVHKVLNSKEEPRIKQDVDGSPDGIRVTRNIFFSNTTIAIAPFVISSEGIRALNGLGYDLCHTCSGDGWDAHWGGPHICPICNGTGIILIKAKENKQEPSEKSVRKTLRLIGQMTCKHDWVGEPGDYSSSYQQTHCTKCDMVMPLWLEDYVYEHRWAWKLIGGIR